MKRIIRNTFKIVNLFTFAVIVMLISSSQVLAVEYVFEEDFSGTNFDQWKFEGTDWNSFNNQVGGTVKSVSHFLSIKDEKLQSTRNTSINQIFDEVSHPNLIKNGVWEFTVTRYSPFYDWGFFLSEIEPNFIGKNSSTINNKAIYIGFSGSVSFYEVDQANNITTSYFNETAFNPNLREVDKEYHYQLTHKDGEIGVYVNSNKIANYALKINFNEFKYFGMFTRIAISFDNFKITEDLSVLPSSDSGDSDDGFVSVNIIFMVSAVSFLALSYKVYFSKKKSSKI